MRFDADFVGPAVEVHLLGTVDFARCLWLQEKLVRQIGSRFDGQICLLLCEHPEIITVGRAGSAADVRTDAGMVRRRQIEVRWVKRGGDTLVHAPGQLAVYPIVPLAWHGFSVGEYLDLLETAILRTLRQLGFAAETRPGRRGVWGRTGQLASIGVAVRDWITWHGAFINVCPSMGLFRLVASSTDEDDRKSCLLAERSKRVKMTTVRSELISQLTEALGCSRYHLHTGHLLLR
jgi:lipoyl(octanoyl) transferase